MNWSKRNEIINKFWQGKTTLEEENSLKNIKDFSENEFVENEYFKFLSSQETTSSDIETDIWSFIETKRNSKKRFIQLAIAASFVLILSITGIFSYKARQLKLEQEYALIEQTFMHLSDELNTSTNAEEIIYEDDYVIIVAEY